MTYRTWDSPDALHGDVRLFAERYGDAIAVELGGKAPSVFGVPTVWQRVDGTMVPFSEAREAIDRHYSVSDAGVPVVTWNAQTGWDNLSHAYSGITTKTIVSGSLDAYIRQYARDVREYGRPMFIRLICGETNGSWSMNCSPNANRTLKASTFVQAWRRVVDIFSAEGVTNVSWVWNMNTFPARLSNWGVDTDISSYYPGDGYVTWVGADHYDYGDPALLNPHVRFALARKKPFFLAEWAIRHPVSRLTPEQEQEWLEAMFDYIEAHTVIKAPLYFNYAANAPFESTDGNVFVYQRLVNYTPNVNDGDSRLIAESGASFRATFARRISDQRYRSEVFIRH